MIDRGMIKWQPFDALDGQSTFIQRMKHRKFAQEMPVLSQDQLEELNIRAVMCFEANQLVQIKYYKNGYFEYIDGIITKLDYVKKQIEINTVKQIKVELIVAIEPQY